MANNPTLFLSRTGYREVGAAGSASVLNPGADINGVLFTGASNITVTADAGTLTGTTLNPTVVTSDLTSVGTLTNLTVTNPINGSVTGSSGSTTGNAATATELQTARNINGVAFNGTANITVTADTPNALTLGTGLTGGSFNGSAPITTNIANTTVTPGTYTDSTITVNAQGQLTSAASKKIYTSSDQNIVSAGALTLTHGLGSLPLNVHIFLVCQNADNGYSPGDIVSASPGGYSGTDDHGISIVPTATTLVIRFGSSTGVFIVIGKGGGLGNPIVNGNWKIRFLASVLI